MKHISATHPVFDHPIYKTIAKAPLYRDQMMLYWQGMGSYCAPTREGHALPQVLAKAGMIEASLLVASIFTSEAGHDIELAITARYFAEHCRTREQVVRADIRSLRHLRAIFDERKSTDPRTIPHNLGILLGIEKLANRNIIPGEVAAFITSGHYDCYLETPEMHYLAEHYGELGAEEDHERKIVAVVSQLPEERAAISAGELTIYEATQAYYSEMQDKLGL
ncbi:hypothetical protein KA517_00570 [Candidatus Gracilibacteria bacterium]|nr:hypothetical protein [Candidatus Gracilibacteria bacterium]